MGFSDSRLSNLFFILSAGVTIYQPRSVHSTTVYPELASNVHLKEPSIVIDKQMWQNGLGGNGQFKSPNFVVDCEIPYKPPGTDAKEMVEVAFKADGEYLFAKNVSLTEGVVERLEANLTKFTGKSLICEVRITWGQPEDPWSGKIVSNAQRIPSDPFKRPDANSDHYLELKEDEVISFRLKSNFLGTPNPCSGPGDEESCSYSVEIHGLQKDAVKLNKCTINLRRNKTFSDELRIFAPRNNAVEKPFRLTLRQRYPHDKSTTKTIQVANGDKRLECKSKGDPHFEAFPNQSGKSVEYDFYAAGDYYLLRTTPNHISPNVEIQVRQFICNEKNPNKPISCNCGVFAREGNTIVGLTVCNLSKPKAIKYVLDNSPSTAVIQKTNNAFKEWKISLLSSGIVIDVDILDWNPEAIDVFVFATEKQLNNSYTGLCSPEARSNQTAHKVRETDSFFKLEDKSQNCWAPTIPIPSCNCQKTNAIPLSDPCKPEEDSSDTEIQNQTITCKQQKPEVPAAKSKRFNDYNSKKRGSIQQLSKGDDYRQKERGIRARAFEVGRRDDEYLPELMARAEEDTNVKELPQEEEDVVQNERALEDLKKWQEKREEKREQRVVSDTIPKEIATESCTEALRLTPTYNLCSDRVDTKYLIDICVTDTTLMNDYGPVKTAPTEFERACLDSITLSLETPSIAADRAKFDEVNRLKTEVEKLICPSQCNQRGKCVDAKCVCESEYIGRDCSLKKGQAPTIKKIVSPVCDIQKEPCQDIKVEASDVVDQGSVTCQMWSIKGSIRDVPAVQTSTTTASGGLVVCRLPSLPVNRESTDASRVAVYTVQVSISNDGQNFSKELPFTVFDGRCVECTTQPEVSCKRKANGCDE